MKIIARIQKVEGGQYLFDGKMFDSFLSARREMAQRMKLRRMERHERAHRAPVATLQAVGT